MTTLDTIRDFLDANLPAAVTVRVGDMTNVAAPRVSVWGPPMNREPDDALAEGGHSEVVGITCTAASEAAATSLAAACIALLSPGLAPRNVGGVVVDFLSSQNATTDRSVVLPGSNTHPAYVTAQFRAHTQES